MADLITQTNLPDPDLAYTAIIDAHRGLSDADSQELNARLVLILANHIGDTQVLAEALDLTRRGLGENRRSD